MTKRIVIKSTSGYGSVDFAYTDRLTITANSISYERKPYLEGDDLFNKYEKWSYKTTTDNFPLIFKEIARAVDEILNRDLVSFSTDVGTTEFIVTHDDGSKISRLFELPAGEFDECFKIIREIVPVTEDVPEVIKIDDGCDE